MNHRVFVVNKNLYKLKYCNVGYQNAKNNFAAIKASNWEGMCGLKNEPNYSHS